jgi:hypothetical protein
MEENNKRDHLSLIINGVAWAMMIVGGFFMVAGASNFIEGGDVFDGLFGIPIFIFGGIILFIGFRLLKRKRF